LPEERETLIGVIAGREPDRWGRPEGEPVDFYHAKGIVEYLLTELGVPTQYRPVERFAYLPGRTAEIAVTGSGAVIGVVGQVHPQVAASFDLDEEVYWFEIDLAALLPHLPGVRVYEPLPRYPAVREDLAVIVDANIEAARVQTLIETAPLVRRVAVFDVYSGPPVPPGKKSLAFSITYQAPDRTLTESEVTRVRDRIIQRLERELGATLRG
jgi:phenylalanyl-tRNA synthetase beta chain